MIRKILFAVLIIGVISPWGLAETFIPFDHQVILKKEGIFLNMLWSRFSEGDDWAQVQETWMPTQEQTQKALEAVYAFLQDPGEHRQLNEWQKGEIPRIKDNLTQYRVQFIGIIVNGSRRCYCNFFSPVLFEHPRWKDSMEHAKDGGFLYWHIEYDIESGKCLNFKSNGYG